MAGVEALLTRIDAALQAGDSAALAALTDPADADLRARWGGLPGRAALVGARDLTLSRAALPAADSSLHPGPARAGYAQTLQVPVYLGYHLPIWDPGPVQSRLTLQVGLRADTWWLVDDVAADDPSPGAASAPPVTPIEPWVRSQVSVTRHEHVLVVGDPGHDADNERLAAALDRAVQHVRSVVRSQRWNGQVVAYAPTDTRIVNSWFGGRAATEGQHAGRDPASFAAEVRTLSGAGASEVSPPVAARLAVTPLLLDRTDATGLPVGSRADAVLRHEVTHVALAMEGDVEPTTWVVEGVAEYTAYRALRGGRLDPVASLDRRGLSTATWVALSAGTWRPQLFDRAEEFYRGSNSQVAQAYSDAWLTCLFIADEFGEKALFALYSAHSRRPGGATAQSAPVSEVLDIDREELVRRTAAYAGELRSRFG